MRKRVLRLSVLILLVSLSISVIGFSSLFSRFEGNNLLLTDLEENDLPFTSLVSTFYDDYGIYTFTDNRAIYYDNSSILDEFPYDYARVYDNPGSWDFMTPKNYFLPNGSPQYASNNVSGFVEVNDFSKMNFNLTDGRYPTNTDEVVITNYILDGFKINGVWSFSDIKYAEKWVLLEDVKDFSDIENVMIWIAPTCQYFYNIFKPYKVVGMISYDLDKYESISEVRNYKETTKEDLELFSILDREKRSYLNCVYVVNGYYDEFARNNPFIFSHNVNISYIDNTISLKPSNNFFTLSNYFFESNHRFSDWNNKYLKFRDGFTESDLGDNQVLINFPVLVQLLGEDVFLKYNLRDHLVDSTNYDIDYLMYIMDEENLWDIPISFEILTQIRTNMVVTTTKELKIVGILTQTIESYIPESPYIYISPNFFEDFNKLKMTSNILVSTPTKEDKINLLNTIKDHKVINDEKLDTVLESGYYFQTSTLTSKLIYSVIDNFAFLSNLFSVISIVFLVFSLIMIYNFVSLSIIDRKKDIGIMRSMGASNFNVSKVFILESTIILLLVIIFSLVLYKVEDNLFNSFYISKITFLKGYDEILVFSFREALIMIVVSIVGFFFSTLIPLLRIRKFMPIVTIRKN
jgi:hypothetical protein